MPTLAIGSLAIDPNDGDIVYAGTGDGNFAHHSPYGLGIYKTTDGGATWSHLAESTFRGRCVHRIVIDPTPVGGVSTTLYAAVVRAGGFPEVSAAKLHPDRRGDVGIFKSTDGGASWTHFTVQANGLPELSATELVMDPTDSDTLYAAIGHIFGDSDNGIYKTTDGGTSWTKLTSGLPAGTDVGRTSLAIAPLDPDVLYALFSNDATASGAGASTYGGFRSDDAGASWEPYGFANQASFGWFVSVVSVVPTDPDIVFFGGVDLRRYTYPDPTADPVLTPHQDQHVLAWDASGRLLSGNDGGLHRSDDLGDTWEHLNGGLSILQCYAGLSVHPTDMHAILVGNQDNGTVRRHGSQMSDWVKVYRSDGGMTAFASATVAYASWQRTGELASSGDGGFTFGGSVPVLGRNAFHNPFQLDPSDPSRIVYATEAVWDNVGGWGALSADVTTESTAAIRALAIAPSDSSVVYVATNDYTNVLSHAPSEPDATVQVSTNGGVSFTEILEQHPGWRRITRELWVHPNDANTAYVARAAFDDPIGQVLRTGNAGGNWQSITGNTFPQIPTNVVALDVRDDAEIIYAGTDSGLYYSVSDGATWYHFTGMPNAIIIDIVVDQARDRLIIGTQGRGVWSVDIDEPMEFGSADFNQDKTIDELDVADFQTALAAGDVYAIDWDLTTGPAIGDLLDLAAFSDEWMAKKK